MCFRAADWDEFPSSRAGTGLGPESNALVLFEFLIDDDDERPYLAMEMSPAGPDNDAIRAALLDAISQNPTVFKSTSNSLTDGWIVLHLEPDYILEPDDYGSSWDDGTARHKIEAWIEDFAVNRFPEMNRIIVHCFRRHQES